MRDNKFTYGEIQRGITVLKQEVLLEKVKEYFRLKE